MKSETPATLIAPERLRHQPLPLIHISLLRPFVQALEKEDIDWRGLLKRRGLTIGPKESSQLLPVITAVDHFLADAAVESGRPHFGYEVGRAVKITESPLFSEACGKAHSLGFVIYYLVRRYSKLTTSAELRLEIGPEFSTLRVLRNYKPEFPPGQKDGFKVGLILSLLQKAVGSKWNAGDVRVTVADLNAIPAQPVGVSLFEVGDAGPQFRFPSVWIETPVIHLFGEVDLVSIDDPVMPSNLLEAIRGVLASFQSFGELTSQQVAAISGLGQERLSKALLAHGTNIKTELRRARLKHAAELLIDTDETISHISGICGYRDATSFSRAFRQWYQLSPREYRQCRRGDSESLDV